MVIRPTIHGPQQSVGDQLFVPVIPPFQQQLLLSRHLTDTGVSGGTINFNGDYSSAQEIAYIQPPSGEIFQISRLFITIQDTGAFRAERYGALGAALTNGISLRVQDDSGTIIDFADGHKIKTNAIWAHFCYDVDVKTWGVGDELLVARWTFSRYRQNIRLEGSDNERLEITLDDDMTGLVGHWFFVEGFEEKNYT